MTDEEMDAFVLTGKDLSVPEGGPVHILTEQDLSDEESLSTRPERKETLDKNFDPYSSLPFSPEPSIGETIVTDIVEHPLSTIESLTEMALPVANPIGWALPLAEALSAARGYAKGTAIDKYLPELGSPYRLFEYLDENPGDWLHLIGAQGKLQGMIANPEDYAE